MPVIAVPGFIEGVDDAVEHLICLQASRRGAYNTGWKIKGKRLETHRLTVVRVPCQGDGLRVPKIFPQQFP